MSMKNVPTLLRVGATCLFVLGTVGIAFWFLHDNPLPRPSPLPPSSAPTPSSPFVGREQLRADVSILSLGIRVPIVWSQTNEEQALLKDLERGALHYPGTADPGEIGNAFITAHSSDYPWKKHPYKYVFAALRKLGPGDDDIYVTYTKDGIVQEKDRFRVVETAIVAADDPRLFAEGPHREMTLVTCWPLGTTWKRLMVKTVLVDRETY